MPESRDVAAVSTQLRSEEEHLLFEDALSMSEDLNEYSFSAELADTLAGLTSAHKVGRLDLNALKSFKRCLPRYLFRAYGPNSGGASPNGQYKDLNSEDAISPHAFHQIDGIITGHDSAAEIPDPATMINGHIGTSSKIRSEFSSWSPSLLLVLCYAEEKYTSRKSAHVCVVDTYKILNGIYHVPNLIHVVLATGECRARPLGGFAKPFPEDYLINGVVSGSGYAALSYGEVRTDIVKVYPEIRNNMAWGYDIRAVKFAREFLPVKITEEHIGLLKGIGKRLDRPELAYPLKMSLICLVKRFDLDYTTPQLFHSPDFAFYARSLRRIIAHLELTDHWLINDLQFTGSMPEVKHTNTMMRALVLSKYGRGKRASLRELTSLLDSTQIQGDE